MVVKIIHLTGIIYQVKQLPLRFGGLFIGEAQRESVIKDQFVLGSPNPDMSGYIPVEYMLPIMIVDLLSPVAGN